MLTQNIVRMTANSLNNIMIFFLEIALMVPGSFGKSLELEWKMSNLGTGKFGVTWIWLRLKISVLEEA